MIGISACLGGICCRYDGQSKELSFLKELVEKKEAMPICPEVLGGLPIPREPAEIKDGDGFAVWQEQASVVTVSGEDVTECFKEGAKIAYQKLLEHQIDTVIVKENSPSCGQKMIYDGTFSGNKITGMGVATAYFVLNGIDVISENEWQKIVKHEDLNG
ncbi:DUF523 domain-containing protein [Enterococcus wangshanyuanii]|uniref:DUF523 domain-containing protein n=1 Tax=Enterococcus wangshanyuanii TaxID=2005703 RepID=A0ABQ1NMB8_9ENTE|nr:DUF523 domain-containing protein [Enterococcus wangshanyuanii]GGC80766.1 hypothetical protein GCM10011573_07980 [Enterococcus wangshanyuanii]